MAPKKQKTQHLPNSSLPPGDGFTEVAVEEEEEYNVDDPMNEDGKEEPLIKESSSSKSSEEIQEMEYCNMVNLAREKVDSQIPGGISLPAQRAAERVYLEFPDRITDVVQGPANLLKLMIDDLSAIMLEYHVNRAARKIASHWPILRFSSLADPVRSVKRC